MKWIATTLIRNAAQAEQRNKQQNRMNKQREISRERRKKTLHLSIDLSMNNNKCIYENLSFLIINHRHSLEMPCNFCISCMACVLKYNFISKQIDLLFYNRKTNHRKGHIHSAKYHKCKCDSSIFIALVIVYEYSSRRRQPHTLNVRLVICNCYSSLDILCAHNAIHWIIKYTSFFLPHQHVVACLMAMTKNFQNNFRCVLIIWTRFPWKELAIHYLIHFKQICFNVERSRFLCIIFFLFFYS